MVRRKNSSTRLSHLGQFPPRHLRERAAGLPHKAAAPIVRDPQRVAAAAYTIARFHGVDDALLSATTHRNPTWLVDVSTGSAWRAADRRIELLVRCGECTRGHGAELVIGPRFARTRWRLCLPSPC